MYWQVYNLLSRLTSKAGFHKCWVLAINPPTDYVIHCSQILLVKKSIKDSGLTLKSPLKLQSEFQVWLAVGLSKRLFAPLVIIFTSIPILVRADLGNEYESQKRQKESLSWDNAPFTGRCDFRKDEARYQILKNGDIYSLYPGICWSGPNAGILKHKEANIYSVRRTSRRECNSGSFGINCRTITYEAQYKVKNCKLLKYVRTIDGDGRVGEIEESVIATCRPGFTQRSK